MTDEKKELIIFSASDLDLSFPEKNEHIEDKVADKTREVISSSGAYTPDGKTFINKKSLPHLLATDKSGANRFYNDLNNEDKLVNGNDKNASIDSIQKELSRRIQEPRDTLERERHRDTEDCLKTLRDHPTIDKYREVGESKIRKNLPKIKKDKLKLVENDEITGEPLTQPEVHHKDRVADKPRRALDKDNLAALNKETHSELHKKGIESKDEFEEYKRANK